MLGDVEVQDFATAVANHKETVQHPEGGGGHGEKVHSGDGFTMVLEKREPALSCSGGEVPCGRYRETVDSEISNPNFKSSP